MDPAAHMVLFREPPLTRPTNDEPLLPYYNDDGTALVFRNEGQLFHLLTLDSIRDLWRSACQSLGTTQGIYPLSVQLATPWASFFYPNGSPPSFRVQLACLFQLAPLQLSCSGQLSGPCQRSRLRPVARGAIDPLSQIRLSFSARNVATNPIFEDAKIVMLPCYEEGEWIPWQTCTNCLAVFDCACCTYMQPAFSGLSLGGGAAVDRIMQRYYGTHGALHIVQTLMGEDLERRGISPEQAAQLLGMPQA